jgi:hypothetical protein
MIVTVIVFVIVNFRARFVNLGHRKNVSRWNVWLTKLAWRLLRNSRDWLMLRLVLQVLLRGHDNLLLQAFLRGPTTKTIKVFLRGIWDKSGRRCCGPQEGRIKGLLNSLVYKVLLIWHIKHPHKWIRRHFSSCHDYDCLFLSLKCMITVSAGVVNVLLIDFTSVTLSGITTAKFWIIYKNKNKIK